MQVSVVVPTHNRADALKQTLQHLSEQKFAGEWEVIVVNNNCTDDTDEIVKKQSFPVELRVVYEKKPGAAAARNAGARIAQGEYLIFIDNDILTQPDFLQSHFETLIQNHNSWVVGQVINLPAQETSAFGKYRKSLFPTVAPDERARETDGITGQTVSLPREHFIELGGFDEKFHVASGEDHEFAMRARKQLGVKTLLVPSIVVIHNDWAGWTFPDFCRRQQMYARTEFYFWQKYGDEHPRQELVRENLPPDWKHDSSKTIIRKKIKQAFGSPILQATLLRLCGFFETSQSFRPVLWRLYKVTLAAAIYKGFQEGREMVLSERQG